MNEHDEPSRGDAALPHLHAISVVTNEIDVVGESIPWAAQLCDRVTVWDLGSTDGTYERLKELESPTVRVTRREDVPYSRAIRPLMLEHIRAELPEGSWLYVLDADEFMACDPKPLLREATAAGANIVRAWRLDFFPTRADIARLHEIGAEAWQQIPLFERLRWYRAEHQERRFLRISEDFSWEERDGRSMMRIRDGRSATVYPKNALVRHYRYRSPEQVARRYGTRREIRAQGYGGFVYDQTARFEDYAVSESDYRRWPDGDALPKIHASDLWRLKTRRARAKVRKLLGRFTRSS